MARKPRMGRNLNALLGSGGRDRREPADEPPPVDEPGVDATPADPPPRTAAVTDLPRARAARGLPAEDDARRPAPARVPAAPADTPSATARGDEATVASGDAASDTASDAASEGASEGASDPAHDPAGERSDNPSDNPSDDAMRPGDRLRMLGVERIRRGVYQPRRFFDQDALQELADSLKAQGMIQPVIVRPFAGSFELIAGERRWRAAQLAGFAEIPAIVRDMEDRTVAAVSLIENIQREDLNPLEEAQALTRLCDEFGMTHAAVAESIGRSRAAVSNLMRLLELHDEVKVLVDKGELDMGHARALLRAPKNEQPTLAQRVVKQGLTVRAVERLIRTAADGGGNKATAADTPADPDVERLEERLSGLLGAPVAIRHSAGGAGRVEIRYASLDELDGILAHIK